MVFQTQKWLLCGDASNGMYLIVLDTCLSNIYIYIYIYIHGCIYTCVCLYKTRIVFGLTNWVIPTLTIDNSLCVIWCLKLRLSDAWMYMLSCLAERQLQKLHTDILVSKNASFDWRIVYVYTICHSFFPN